MAMLPPIRHASPETKGGQTGRRPVDALQVSPLKCVRTSTALSARLCLLNRDVPGVIWGNATRGGRRASGDEPLGAAESHVTVFAS
jgi:hypothetical protein